jgi:hypothetical protein
MILRAFRFVAGGRVMANMDFALPQGEPGSEPLCFFALFAPTSAPEGPRRRRNRATIEVGFCIIVSASNSISLATGVVCPAACILLTGRQISRPAKKARPDSLPDYRIATSSVLVRRDAWNWARPPCGSVFPAGARHRKRVHHAVTLVRVFTIRLFRFQAQTLRSSV